ncbi:MAG: hypothetical protein ACU0BF_00690 [Paracoccaceae bacterium]
MTTFWTSGAPAIPTLLSHQTVGDHQKAAQTEIPGGKIGSPVQPPANAQVPPGIAEKVQLNVASQELIRDTQALIAIEQAKPNPDAALLAGYAATVAAEASDIATRNTQIATLTYTNGLIHGPYVAAARAVFPHLDGRDGQTLPSIGRPASFDSAAPADFAQWHSSYQNEWLRAQGVVPGGHKQMTLNGTTITYVRSSDGTSVINTHLLEKADIAKMSFDDQIALTNTPDWPVLSRRLNLDAVSTSDIATLKGTRDALVAGALGAASAPPDSTSNAYVFWRQVDILVERMEASPIADIDAIEKAAGEVATRFERVKTFAEAQPGQPLGHLALFNIEPSPDVVLNDIRNPAALRSAVSTDGNKTINGGVTELMRAERAMLASLETRHAASTSTFRDPRIDVPNLIFRLQSLYETSAEALTDAGTEEMRQLHRLLSDYAVMQDMVSRTIAAFDPSKANEKRRFLNIGLEPDGKIDDDQIVSSLDTRVEYGALGYDTRFSDDRPKYLWFRDLAPNLTGPEVTAFLMFSKDYFAGNQAHPIEKLYGVERPKTDFIDDDKARWDPDARKQTLSMKLEFKTFYDQLSTRLSEAVTQLNQQNQIKQNDIDSAAKQQNRHFELGNNALRKMNDMIMSIGRM